MQRRAQHNILLQVQSEGVVLAVDTGLQPLGVRLFGGGNTNFTFRCVRGVQKPGFDFGIKNLRQR